MSLTKAFLMIALAILFWTVWYIFVRVMYRRKQKKWKEFEQARKQEELIGKLFADLAYGKWEMIKCLVYERHRPWGKGYRVWLTWLGEPDTILSVTVDFSRRPRKRIMIESWPTTTYYAADSEGLQRSTGEFESYLAHLLPSVSSVA